MQKMAKAVEKETAVAMVVVTETAMVTVVAMTAVVAVEPLEQAERERLMQAVRQRGFIDDYRGVRISAQGRRFLIEQAIVWNVIDAQDRVVGQAAMFDQWEPLA